jgi:hypothetical protein
MSTIQATNLKHASSASNNIVLDSSGNATFAGTPVPNSSFLRNRIINGDMRIDQRNAGASVTPTSGQYLVDRFVAYLSQTSKFTAQQNAGSVTPPGGFKNYLGATSSSAYSVTSTDEFEICQAIEGFNVADLGWGAANAQTITLSFWVRSSLTGTFGGFLKNNAGNRGYVFSYSISAANTWEQKSVTISGDTTGTWASDNSIGILIGWSIGAGSSKVSTAGSWSSTVYVGVTGQVNLVGTNGATFYITGVQLEVGTAATPFERRQYGQELALCQRYYEKSYALDVIPGTNLNNTSGGFVGAVDPNPALNGITGGQFKVPKRAVPTAGLWSQLGVVNQVSGWQDNGVTKNVTTIGMDTIGISIVDLSSKPDRLMRYQWVASAEL